MRLALSGGGTGGHIYPSLAVTAALREIIATKGPLELLYIGVKGRMDEELLTAEIIPFRSVRAGPLRGRTPWGFVAGAFNLMIGTIQARRTLKQYRPHIVFVTGGYASVPTAVAARMLGLPLLVYLPDIRPGWSVRLTSRFAKQIAVTSEASLPYLPKEKTVVTGYPVRRGFEGALKDEGRRRMGLEADVKTLIVSGGSQGSHSINRIVAKDLEELLELCQIVHVSGAADFKWLSGVREELPEEKRRRYHVHAYLHREMPWAMAAADLALSRAGASTLGELPILGLPAVLAPGPFADQSYNARYLSERGASLTLTNSHLERNAVAVIKELLADDGRRSEMSEALRQLARPDAARQIAGMLIEMAKKNGNGGGR